MCGAYLFVFRKQELCKFKASFQLFESGILLEVVNYAQMVNVLAAFARVFVSEPVDLTDLEQVVFSSHQKVNKLLLKLSFGCLFFDSLLVCLLYYQQQRIIHNTLFS
jgi:hypothetical protein